MSGSDFLHRKFTKDFRIRSSSLILPRKKQGNQGGNTSPIVICTHEEGSNSGIPGSSPRRNRKTHSLYNLFAGNGKTSDNHRLLK